MKIKNMATLTLYAGTCLKTELKRTKRLEELQAITKLVLLPTVFRMLHVLQNTAHRRCIKQSCMWCERYLYILYPYVHSIVLQYSVDFH